jgi:hypothetical protein
VKTREDAKKNARCFLARCLFLAFSVSLCPSTPLPLYPLIWYKIYMFRKNVERVLFEIPSFFQFLKEIERECNKNRGAAS